MLLFADLASPAASDRYRNHVDLVAEIGWNDQEERPAETRLDLLRNRSGPARTIPLLFWGHHAQSVQR